MGSNIFSCVCTFFQAVEHPSMQTPTNLPGVLVILNIFGKRSKSNWLPLQKTDCKIPKIFLVLMKWPRSPSHFSIFHPPLLRFWSHLIWNVVWSLKLALWVFQYTQIRNVWYSIPKSVHLTVWGKWTKFFNLFITHKNAQLISQVGFHIRLITNW